MAERDWIRRYFAPLASAPGAAGLTDDTAQLAAANGPVVITTDAMVEGVHFLAGDPIASLARKLVRVNVSDILASGAEPAEALLTLGWPEGRPEAELAAFASALGEELSAWGAVLIGGDTVSSPAGLFLSLTLTGRCLGAGPVRRGGAGAGDELWVTGEIGGARRGFLARAAGEASPWIEVLQVPDLPPLAAAGLVARHATAAMDVSDGLLGDARSLAEASGTGVEIDFESVPFAGGPAEAPERLDLSIWGDDYQLLFTAPPAAGELLLREAAQQGIRLSRIGRIRSQPGLLVSSETGPVNLPETVAFEHGRIGMSATRP
ncbi:thiamine-phosphate kinase [Hyphomonas sp.]|uniref:thiamine-phosphate kinase n=1 Tax=Hyphomonas sp. TaxID=87 RepID=UPI0025C60688|nr:thiamine-phosphate kinase [Hyphomonas sp.]